MPGMRIVLSADEASSSLARFRGNLTAVGAESVKTQKQIKDLEQQMLRTANQNKITNGFNDLTKMMGMTKKEAEALKKELRIDGDIGSGLDKISGKTNSLAMTFGKLALAITGAWMTFKAMVSPWLSYLGRIETSTLGIATSLMMNNQYIAKSTGEVLKGERALDAAIVHSTQIMNDLQVANMETTASLEDLVDALQYTLPVAMAKGFDVKMAEDFTVAMVKAAGAIGLPFDQLQQETRALLTGQIDRNARIAQVLGLTNKDIAQFKGDAKGLFEFLMNELKAYEIAGARSAKTWAGVWSNVGDVVKRVMGEAFEPLFEEIKSELFNMSDGLYKVVEKTDELGRKTKSVTWNPALTEGIQTVKKIIIDVITQFHIWGAMLDKIGGTMTTLAAKTARVLEFAAKWVNILMFMKQMQGLNSAEKGLGNFAKSMERSNKNYEKRYLENERWTMDMAMKQEGLAPVSNEELAAIAKRGYNPSQYGYKAVQGEATSDQNQGKWYWYKMGKAAKSDFDVIPNKPKKGEGDEGKGGSGREAQLEDLRTRLREQIASGDKDEYAKLDLEYEKIKRDFIGSGKKKKAISPADLALLEKWKASELEKIYAKEDKEYEEFAKKRRDNDRRILEAQYESELEYEDRVFSMKQDSAEKIDALQLEQGIISETDALDRKFKREQEGNDQAIKALQTKLLYQNQVYDELMNEWVDTPELIRMKKELEILQEQGRVMRANHTIEKQTSDLRARRESIGKLGYYSSEYEGQQKGDLAKQIKEMKGQNLDPVTIAKWEAEQIEQIDQEKYKFLMENAEDYVSGIKAYLNLITIESRNTAKAWVNAFVEGVEATKGALSDMINDTLNGEFKSIEDYASSLLKSINRSIANAFAENFVNGMLGKMNGGGGSWIETLTGGLLYGKKSQTPATETATSAISNFTGALKTGANQVGESTDGLIGALGKMASGLWSWISGLFSSFGSGGGIQSFGSSGGGSSWLSFGTSLVGSIAGSGFSGGSSGSGSFMGTNQSGGYFSVDPNLVPSAKGNVFSNGLRPWENRIVDSPTFFKFAKGGRIGVMGEAGSEAIMPLARDASGRLGVRSEGSSSMNISVPISINSPVLKRSQLMAELRREMEDTAVKVIKRVS